MLSQNQMQQVEPRIRVLQMICLGLLGGAIAMALVMFALREPPKLTTVFGIFQIVGVGLVALEMLPSFLIPRTMRIAAVNEVAKSTDRVDSSDAMPNRLVEGFVTSKIVKYAIYQGAILMNLVFWLIDGSVYNLAAAGFCFLLIVGLFPTTGRALQVIEGMLQDARAGRQR